MVQKAITLEPEKYRFHGTRKGFATQLLKCGVSMSLIAYAGRWQMREAIFDYLIHSKRDLLCLARVYFYGKGRQSWDDPMLALHTSRDALQKQMSRLRL